MLSKKLPKEKRYAGLDESHPVYSDFAYLGTNVGNLVFAVGLREDAEASEAVVNRILPLRKTVPKPIVEKKSFKKKEVIEEICNRPDCTAKRERLQECVNENEHLRAQLKSIENRVGSSKNKLTIMEKSIALAEEKNETVQGLIDETQARIAALDMDVNRGEYNNEALRNKLAGLQKEIELLKQQTEEHSTVMQSMSSKAVQKVIFGTRPRSSLQGEEAAIAEEVSALGLFSQRSMDDDSDDERGLCLNLSQHEKSLGNAIAARIPNYVNRRMTY
eukprot:gene13788-29311_t